MFIHAVKDNKGKKQGYYCSLVRSVRNKKGTCTHETILNFGYIPKERLPYLRAAFNKGNPEEILERQMRKQKKDTSYNG